tara:strand:+ start:335 stop:1360 length:1026 start_codon:yes stop_codon:yes gene_type:complete
MFEYNTKNKTFHSIAKSTLKMENVKERSDFQKAIIHSWDSIKSDLNLTHETSLIDEEIIPHSSVLNRIDLLAFDPFSGELIVIELKKDKDKLQLLQSLTYAAMVSNWDKEQLIKLIEKSNIAKEKTQLLDDINKLSELDKPIKIILLSERYDPEVIITAEWLKKEHNVDITAYSYSIHKMNNKLLMSITQKFPLKEIEDMYVSRTTKSRETSIRKNITWTDVIESLKYKDEFGKEAINLCLKEMSGDPFRTRFTHIRSKNHHSKEEEKNFPYQWISLWFRQKYMRVYISIPDFCRNSGKHEEAIKFLKKKSKAEINEWRDGYSLVIRTKNEYNQIKKWLRF